MRAARRAPQLEAGHPAEHQQRLTDRPGGALHEYVLASLHPGRSVQELVCCRPTQDQGSGLCRVNARWHVGQITGAERAVGHVRSDYREIGHAFAEPKTTHAVAKLVDFSNDVVAHNERWPARRGLRVGVAPNGHVSVLHARGENANPHLASRGCSWRSVDDLQFIGIAIAPEPNDAVTQHFHGRTFNNPMTR